MKVMYEVVAVPTKRIFRDGTFNCRGEFTLQSVKDLADSIVEVGEMTHPIWVQPACDVVGGIPDGYDFRLIAGHRRHTAAETFLKWKTVPARIMEGLSEEQARLLNFVENLERKDLSPLEEAIAISRNFPATASQADIARRLKKDSRWVSQRFRILQVPPEVQQLIHARRVTLLDLELICARDNPADQIRVANTLANSRRGRGIKRKAVLDGKPLERSFKRRRTKEEINRVVAKMLNIGLVDGIGPAMGAWCAGHITDDELSEVIGLELVMRGLRPTQ